MPQDGLQRLSDFLDRLDNEGVHYQIDQVRPEALLVFFTPVGTRVEVDVFPDHMTYRCFTGNEDVFHDDARLKALME